MARPTRALSVRLIGVIVGLVFATSTVHDFRSGQYSWHGSIVEKADRPALFWACIALEALGAVIGLMVAVFGIGNSQS